MPSAATSASSRSRTQPDEDRVRAGVVHQLRRSRSTLRGSPRMPTVVLVGTLDTKGKEYAFLGDRLRERGVDVLLVDAGIVGEPLTTPDVTREEVAAAAGG